MAQRFQQAPPGFGMRLGPTPKNKTQPVRNAGAAIAKGLAVILDTANIPATGEIYVATSTTFADARGFGVTAGIIPGTGKGYVIREGYATVPTSNDHGNISVGDVLCISSKTAGFLEKAVYGNGVALALAAQTGDSTLGTASTYTAVYVLPTLVGTLADAVQDQLPTITITAGAEASHHRQITVAVLDSAGNALAEYCVLRVFVNATSAYAAPAATGTDTFAAPNPGAILVTHTALADYTVVTGAAGTYSFLLTHNDAGTNRHILVTMDGKTYVSGAIAFDAV